MSDFMFMLENHLSADQSRAVAQVRSAASAAGINVFLTGGALRDMIAGLPIVEIDFTVEGDGIKFAKSLEGVQIVGTDEARKAAQVIFPGGVCGSIGIARQETYSKPGAKPQIKPATIHEDLRGRDFTINSIALSLNAASRGLLIDPTNGVGDLERKELRGVTNYSLYDDPVRLLRLQRFRVRLGFTIVERTLAQYANAREAGLASRVSAAALQEELRRIASEQNVADVIRVLEEEKLLELYSPALSGPKLNTSALLKLQKAKQLIPFGTRLQQMDHLSVLLNVLTEKFTPAERTALAETIALSKEQVDAYQKLDARAKKLERDLKGAQLQKPSKLYALLSKAAGDAIVYLIVRSSERLVQDRIKNFLQKYLPAALEVTDADVVAAGGAIGSPKFERLRSELIATR
ncbi:MAG: hypothetical protein JO022_00190, partial [Acidobacteriaceae bacterium]|nr:hypothetical protein [Acidobacteriaceae bacterium]